ncbi:uncharacterized protein LOC125249474 [Megalobrama amblycephala]|uniref:uncharacterized protein LOC125249474 n=1 Tax=Megalobrama amblycephala TaxID=75352 RepID=UPI002014594B|nr:uncharacterized protein LOC125249474 [Megalobrama amblycephala]
MFVVCRKTHKKKNLIRRAWEAEKHPNQSQETKVCAFVPEQESEQELPHTSSVEPTDRESPVINTQNACVGLQKVRRKKRSPPKERRVPQDLTLPEIEKKHTKKKNLIRRAWEAVKHPNQSQETKVCAFVPEQESEQELPHTSSVEPTDQKHTKKKNLIRRAWEAVKHPNQSQETKVCAFVPEQESEQELPHTSSVEPTDQKHTKKKNLIRRAWEAVKHPNQSQETKVCAFVPEQESEQELPHTSSVEPTDQKHTKKKNLIRRAWEAVKHPNQSQETKVCAFVPEQESEQELPHTSSVEPTDQKHTKKKNLIRRAWEAVKHPNQSQETKVCAFVPEQESEQELPHTSSVEPTDQKHTKKKNLIRRAWEAVKHPNQSQETKVCAFVPEQEQELPHTSSVEPTDRESPVISTQNACVGLQKVWREKCPRPKRIKVPPYLTLGEIEIFKEHVRWCREIGFFEWSIEAREQHNSEYFRFLYEVGEKLGSENDEVHTHEGIRNSDGQKVAIKFVKPERQIGVRSKPVCEEARLMLKVQAPTTCEYIVKLYDWFIMDEKDVLIVEYHPSVTLPEFIKEYSDRLSEEVVKHIIWQLTIALRHCMELGVLHDADLENILINQDTMQMKLINFSNAMQLGPDTIRRGAVELIISALHTAMKELIDGLPFEKKTHLSKECLDVLRKIQKNKALGDTLDAILDHAWFKKHSQTEEERNQEK